MAPTSPPAVSLGAKWHCQSHTPFPAGMREQPLGPDLCLLTSIPRHSSCYSTRTPHWAAIDNANIRTRTALNPDGNHTTTHTVKVAYPHVDFQGPRGVVGWAATQWQALVWTTLDIIGDEDVVLASSISAAPEFAVVPSASDSHSPVSDSAYFEWYRGDFYGYDAPHSLKGSASVPHLLKLQPGRYYLFVRTLYEVRVFGDPQRAPEVAFTADFEHIKNPMQPILITSGNLFLVPDVINGSFPGSLGPRATLISIGIRNPSHSVWSVSGANSNSEGFHVDPSLCDIVPLSTSKLMLKVTSLTSTPIEATSISISLSLISKTITGEKLTCSLPFEISLQQVAHSRDPNIDCSYKVTYEGVSGVEIAVLVPPMDPTPPSPEMDQPLIIVALHGAGVEVGSHFWRTSLRRQPRSWIVLPSGLTPWGLDWQLASFESWKNLLRGKWYMPFDSPFISGGPSRRYFLIGHSNGGQGTWYGLNHLRDQCVAGIVAAGYISLQEYVPFIWSYSRHSTDPTLQAILDAALIDFRNDLHISNLVGLPLLVKYGKDDNNVPPWHSRAIVSQIKAWNAESGVKEELWPKLHEIEHRGHWWDDVLKEDDVQLAIDAATAAANDPYMPPDNFTLTCCDPSTMDSFFGWKILEVDIPGRIARLEVSYVTSHSGESKHSIHLQTSNVRCFQMAASTPLPPHYETFSLLVDHEVAIASHYRKESVFLRDTQGWTIPADRITDHCPCPRQLSSITSLLAHPRFLLIIPSSSLAGVDGRREAYASVARRWTTDLLLYLSADVQILSDIEFCNRAKARVPSEVLLSSSWIFFGGPQENLALLPDSDTSTRSVPSTDDGEAAMVKSGTEVATIPLASPGGHKSVPFIHHLSRDQWRIRDRVFAGEGTALLYSLPHPNPPRRSLVLTGTSPSGIERAGRLLPVRTGTGLPEWLVVGPRADRFAAGAGGVEAAGWYDRVWGWSREMSYLP